MHHRTRPTSRSRNRSVSISLAIGFSLLMSLFEPFAIASGTRALRKDLSRQLDLSSQLRVPGRSQTPVLPQLADLVRKTSIAPPSTPLSVPSAIRSPHNPLQPRKGREVGDPWPSLGNSQRPAVGDQQGGIVAHASNKETDSESKALEHSVKEAKVFPLRRPAISKLNHARAKIRAASPSPIGDDQFIQNFFQWALVRPPNSSELSYWDNILRVAYAHGQGSMMIAARELGKTLFESAEYAARSRSDHDYVYDLYKTYLMRDPDQPGWDFWTSLVASYGRAQVRRGFDESAEFASDASTIAPNGPVSGVVSSLLTARVASIRTINRAIK